MPGATNRASRKGIATGVAWVGDYAKDELVSVDPRSGEILAYVGGGDYARTLSRKRCATACISACRSRMPSCVLRIKMARA